MASHAVLIIYISMRRCGPAVIVPMATGRSAVLGGSVSVQTVCRLIAAVDYSVAICSCFEKKGFEQIAMGSNEIRGSLYVNLGARCWWRSCLRHCATSRKVAGSIPDGIT
jgi:hypothetical protein